MFTVTVEELDEVVVLRCHGSLVRGEETNLLCTALHYHGRDVVLDLSDLHTMDAAGIGALISLQTAGIYLRLQNPNKAVSEILHLTGMESVFEIGDFGLPVGAAESLMRS